MNALVGSLLLAVVGQAGLQPMDPRQERVDKVFAAYARQDVPGCTVGISEGGHLAYAKGYGMADLAWDIPITPDTVFDVASDAKQFTAFAIALLASRGKLSLEDDIRLHIPELRDFGQRVTLRHMLEHTSGLPDHVTLAGITGRRGGAKLTPELVLRLLSDVRELDFAPGTDWTYSNSNFFLLGLVVERVSGRPLGDFLQTEAFEPAGMARTLYQPDPQPSVRGRATPYVPFSGGFLIAPYPSSDGGGKGIQSTVKDMLGWAHALDGGKLGGSKLADAMRTPRKLKTGERLTYGMGLDMWTYRGTPVILHGGVGTGYRSQTIRFPKFGTAISILCNRGDAQHDRLARAVADAWLGERLAAVASPRPFGPAHSAAAGDYINEHGLVMELRVEGDRASAEGLTSERLIAADAGGFTFETGARPARIEMRPGGELLYTPGQGRPAIYRRFEKAVPAPAELALYAGRYHSPDYDVPLKARVEGGHLMLVAPDGLVHRLRPTTQGRFAIGRGTSVTFERGQDGAVSRLILSTPRARRVLFQRA